MKKVVATTTLLQWCQENDWFPDTLINNAGFGRFGDAVSCRLSASRTCWS